MNAPEFAAVLRESAGLTAFVFLTMLAVEHLNALGEGPGAARLGRRRAGGYLLALFIGVVPGGFSDYALVALYAKRLVSPGEY